MKNPTASAYLVRALMISMALCLFASPSSAASFDCTKVGTKVEKIICADPELSKLDEDLSSAYGKAIKESPEPSSLKNQQRDWVKERDKCTNSDCVKTKYQDRIANLVKIESEVSKLKTNTPLVFKLRENSDWTVCHDFVKSLNNVQPSKASFSCSVQFDSDLKQLGWPQWEELKIQDHWDEVYAIESIIYRNQTVPPFEIWKEQYLDDMRSGFASKFMRGVFHPRLRRARVRFEPEGDLETILAYTRERNSVERCKDLVATCMSENEPKTTKSTTECIRSWASNHGTSKESAGEHIVVYNPNNHQIRFILAGGKGSGASSGSLEHVILHDGNAYLVFLNVSGISISRVKKVVPDNQEMTPWEFGEQICGISSAYPRILGQ